MSLTPISIVLSVLAAQEAAPRSVDQVFRPGEQAVWRIEAQGKPIGHHASRYEGSVRLEDGEAHLFHGEVRLELGPDLELRTTADLWTDPEGHPLRFVQHALVGESYSRVEIALDDGGAKASIVQGPSERELPIELDPDAYLLANNFLSHLEILLALREPAEDEKLEIFSASTLQPLRYALEGIEPCEGELDGRPVSGRSYRDSLGERLCFAGGRLLEVEIPAQKIVMRRSGEPAQPIAIEPPALARARESFDSEEVLIERAEVRLAGLVTRPKSPPPPGERRPGVFFVSGSGAQDRNGFSSGIDLGTHELLDRLTAEGFLVLRVDDRGAGESSALPPDARLEDLVADARACVEHLLRREDVDPARVALIGHSEGGAIVPILAAELPIAAVVLMAAPGRSILEILEDQNRLALELQGLEGDELELELQEAIRFLSRLASEEEIDPASVSAEFRASLPVRAWLQSHAHQDPIANLRRLRCPVLILQGAKDFQVSAERDARVLEAALADAGHPDHELHVFPELDHLFKRTPGERSQLADYWKERPVDPEFLDVVSAWLRARLIPGSAVPEDR